MSTLFPEKKVNLVEEEDWKKNYDPAGNISEYAWQNAVDTFEAIIIGGGECKDYVSDMVSRLSDTQLQVVCEFLGEHDNRLEETRNAIQDALQWAFEIAYTPEDRDIQEAFDTAIETVAQQVYFRGELLEGTLEGLGIDQDRFLESVLGEIEYKRPKIKGHLAYDRYIVFSFGESELLKRLAQGPFFIQKTYPEGPKEWSPGTKSPKTKAEAHGDIQEALQELTDDMLSEFWKALDKEMERVDIFNRVDSDVQWKNILQDESRLKGVRREIKDFLKEIKEAL